MPDGNSEFQSMPVSYEVDDLVALSKLVGRSPAQVARLCAGALLVLLLCVILAQVWALTGFVDWSSVIVASVVALVVLVFSSRRLRAYMWLKIAARSAHSGPHSYAIGGSGLRISSPRSCSEIKWTAFTDVRSTAARLFLFMNSRQAYIVPARAFREKEQFDAFSAAALRHWEDNFAS